MKAIIAAGGKGNRMWSVASDLYKPLLPVDGVPVLKMEIIFLRDHGMDDIIITVSHMAFHGRPTVSFHLNPCLHYLANTINN